MFPPVGDNKGEGIRRLIEGNRLKSVIYLGDDVSDAVAFRMLRVLQALGLQDSVCRSAACRLTSSPNCLGQI